MNFTTTLLRRSLLLLVVLSSCAVPNSGSYQKVAPEDIPFGLSAPQTTIPQTTTTVLDPISTESIAVAVSEPIDLFFISNSRIIKVQRNVASPANPAQALSSLVEGPSTSPEFVGLRTTLPTTFVASVDVIRGVAQVDATSVFLDSLSGLDQKLAIAQIVLTLTSRPGVGQVLFSVDGKLISVPRGRGDSVCRPGVGQVLFSVDGKLISVPRGRGDSVASGVAVTFDDYSSLINQQ